MERQRTSEKQGISLERMSPYKGKIDAYTLYFLLAVKAITGGGCIEQGTLPQSFDESQRECFDPNNQDGLISFETPRYVPVVVYRARREDNSGGVANSTLQRHIKNLNKYFNKMNIHFDVMEIVEVFDDELFCCGESDGGKFDKDEYERRVLDFEIRNRRDGVLNLFYFNKPFDENENDEYKTTGSFSRTFLTVSIFYENDPEDTTLTHEVGHLFGLDHTFARNHHCPGMDGENGGDCISDTPVDPGYFDLEENPQGCEETCTLFTVTGHVDCEVTCGVDQNGNPYDPDTDNIMSYYTRYKPRFSVGQMAVMKCMAENSVVADILYEERDW